MWKQVVPQQILALPYGAETEVFINRTLVHFGVLPHIRGYQYISEALIMIKETGSNIDITPNIYYEIAEKHYTTPKRVEKAIRHAIDISWNIGGENTLKHYFTVAPSNTDFLMLIIRWINL